MDYEDNQNAEERFEEYKKKAQPEDILDEEIDNLKIFEIEKNNRIALYKNKINETFNINNDDAISNEIQYNFKEELMNDKNEIIKSFDLYKRDKVLFRIEDGKQKFFDNLISSVNKNEIVISNPFITYANKIFPKQIKCFIEEDGNEYSFSLTKKNENDNGAYIHCEIPSEINILRKRSSARVNDFSQSAVGIYLDTKNKEFIGQLRDISKTGIGFSFCETAIDNDSLSLMGANSDYTLPIILEIKGNYITVLINIKYIEHNNISKMIDVGASFEYLEQEEKDSIAIIFSKIEKDSILFRKKEKTKSLIIASKMNIDI